MATAAVFGSTGAVGGQILSTLLTLPNESFAAVKTISRRAPTETSPRLDAIIETDSSQWTTRLSTLTPSPSIVFSAIGTSRAAAGGIPQQWAIDHDLCIEIARAAKAAGVSTFVFISSAGCRSVVGKRLPYGKMKNGVEDAIRELDFEHAVILRPGTILARETPKAAAWENFVEGMHRVSQGLQDMFGQDQKVIGRAAVAAAQQAHDGKAPSKYWILSQSDVVRLGRTEWKDPAI